MPVHRPLIFTTFLMLALCAPAATLAANIELAPATPGVIAHRKAVLMIRQSLDPDSVNAK